MNPTSHAENIECPMHGPKTIPHNLYSTEKFNILTVAIDVTWLGGICKFGSLI